MEILLNELFVLDEQRNEATINEDAKEHNITIT